MNFRTMQNLLHNGPFSSIIYINLHLFCKLEAGLEIIFDLWDGMHGMWWWQTFCRDFVAPWIRGVYYGFRVNNMMHLYGDCIVFRPGSTRELRFVQITNLKVNLYHNDQDAPLLHHMCHFAFFDHFDSFWLRVGVIFVGAFARVVTVWQTCFTIDQGSFWHFS